MQAGAPSRAARNGAKVCNLIFRGGNRIVTLETQRLIIRDYLEADLDDPHHLLSHKATLYYLGDITTTTRQETAENLCHVMVNTDGHYFCVRGKPSGEYIGSVGYPLTADTPLGKVVHLGYFLLPEHWNTP